MGVYSGPDTSETGLVLALDPANKKSYSQNEFQYSTDIFTWCSTAGLNACTISRDTISSPVGNTPLKMAVTGNDPHIGTYNSSTWNIAPAANGQTWVVSVYVKADVATTGQIFIFGANSSGTGFVNGAWLTITSTTFNITTEWTRVNYYVTMADATIAYIHVRLDGPDTGGTGQTIWWDGLQVERVPSGTTTPTSFTSSYYGGSVFRDLSGNSNTGTLTNGPFYSGSNGGTLVFDGSNDHIVPTGLTDSFFQGNWTISFWVNFDTINTTSVDSSDKVLLQHGSFGTRTALHLNQRNSRLYFGMFFDDLSGTRTLSTGTWYHIVFTLNNTTYAKRIYINGVLDNSHTGGGAYTGTGNNAKIGQSVSANGVNFDGFMSSCVFYNRVLSASEVQQNFNATRGRFGV